MEKVIYNLVFNRKKRLNAEGKALVQVEAYMNKQKRYFSTKVYIKPSQWDNKRRIVKNHPNMDAINRHLRAFMAELERMELGTIQNGHTFSLNDLNITSLPDISSFLEFMKNEIIRGNLKSSTLKNHLSTLHVLSHFRSNILFRDLTFKFLCDFECYMLNLKYHRNTIAKHMKHLKRYINLAINKDLFDLQKYPFRKYKIKYSETQRTHLTPNELQRLENVDCKGRATWRRSLDMFLFSCYTGLRFSDIAKIRKENFHYIDGNLWLIYSSVKTDVNIRLPLFLLFNGKSIPIYYKYRNRHGETLFNIPASANSNVNKQLQRICKLASINRPITFHCARHTNATLLLYNGANITTVQKLLGHKSVRTTEIYSKIMDMTIIRDLERIGCQCNV